MSLDINTLIFNGFDSLKDLGVGVTAYPAIPSLNENYEEYKVEGRNGSLIVKKGTYDNRQIKFNLVLRDFNDSNFWNKMDFIESWLTNIKDNRLFYDRLDKCFRVKNVIKDDIKRQAHYGEGEFEITFLCEPFLTEPDTVEIDISNNYELEYAGNINTLPLVKVYGNGNIQLHFNKNTIQVKNLENYIEIDSRLKQVRNEDKRSKDLDTLGNFPVITPGTNTISWDGNISKVTISFLTNYR